MRHRALEIRKKSLATQPLEDHHVKTAAIEVEDTTALGAKNLLDQRAETLRASLDKIRWTKTSRQRTDFWALVLLRLRIGAARETWNVLKGSEELVTPQERLALASFLVRWRPDERQLAMRKRWEALDHIGEAVLADVVEASSDGGQVIVESLNRAQRSETVTKTNWDKWSERAWDIVAVSSLVDPHAIESLYGPRNRRQRQS